MTARTRRCGWRSQVCLLCPVLGMRARSSDPFLAQCLSKFDVAVEPTRGPQCPALAAEQPHPPPSGGCQGGGCRGRGAGPGAAPQGVISGPQLVSCSPGAGRATAQPGTNLVIVLTPLLGPTLHPSSWSRVS